MYPTPFTLMSRSLRDHAEGAIILISSPAARQGAEMAAPHSNRIPIRGWLVPLVALAVGLVVGKNDAWIVGAALAVLLIGSVMVAVHHAELVALEVGEAYGTLVLTLAVTSILLSLI